MTPHAWKKKVSKDSRHFDGVTYSLDEELEHESRRRETSKFVRQHPSGNQTSTDECRNAHCTPTADPLGEVTDDCAADASASFHQDACCRRYGVVHAFLGSQECGVTVLGGVRVEVEPLCIDTVSLQTRESYWGFHCANLQSSR
jgi:hypothetical protein